MKRRPQGENERRETQMWQGRQLVLLRCSPILVKQLTSCAIRVTNAYGRL
jgi:hypothetical protein